VLKQLHEAMVGIIREQPQLLPMIYVADRPTALDDFDNIVTDSADLGTATAPELRADVLVRVEKGGKTTLTIVVEVQLDHARSKFYSWPVYVTSARNRHRSDALLLVVTPSETVAKWARKPIHLGPTAGFIQAVVIGPGQMPAITDAEKADQYPELAAISAITHGHSKQIELSVKIAQTAIEAALKLPDHRAQVYYDLIWAALSAEVKEALKMIPQNYQYQHEGLRRAKTEGKAEGVAEGEAKGEAKGKAEGEAIGVAESLLDVLRLRGLSPTATQRRQIHATKDVAQLRRWLEAAMSATTVANALKR
jgi:hypothetical protein